MSVCPKCGADLAGEGIGFTDYSCGTSVWDDVGVRESFDCLRRQLQQRDAVIYKLREELGRLKAVVCGEDYAIVEKVLRETAAKEKP